MTEMIDIHAHWRPAEVADALRARTREPRILRNSDGVEVLKAPRMGEAPLAEAFDDLDFHLAEWNPKASKSACFRPPDPSAGSKPHPLTCPGRRSGPANAGLPPLAQRIPDASPPFP